MTKSLHLNDDCTDLIVSLVIQMLYEWIQLCNISTSVYLTVILIKIEPNKWHNYMVAQHVQLQPTNELFELVLMLQNYIAVFGLQLEFIGIASQNHVNVQNIHLMNNPYI